MLIIAIPRVINQPQHVFNADPGSTISLSLEALNARAYQWQVNDTDLRESNKYTGIRTSSLMIHNIEEDDEGFYSCIINNEFLSERSHRAAVTVCKYLEYGVNQVAHCTNENVLNTYQAIKWLTGCTYIPNPLNRLSYIYLSTADLHPCPLLNT